MRNKVPLGTLCITPPRQIREAENTLIDYIDISSVDSNKKEITGFQTLRFGDAPSRARKPVKKNSILVSTVRPNLNAVAQFEKMTPNNPVASTGFCVLDCKENVDPRYVFNYCKSKAFVDAMVSKATGASYPAVTDAIVRDALIPEYTYEEQRYIAQVLDKTSLIIDRRRAELDYFDNLIKAQFVEMFGDPEINPKGWEKGPLKEYAEVLVGYPFPSEGYSEEGINIVGGYNLMQGYIQWDDSKHWPSETGYEQYLLQANDIVMAMDRPWVNGGFKIARVDISHLPALLIQRTACIRGQGLRQEFLHILLDSQRFAEHCNVTGSLVPHISNKDINSFQVILPPIELQREFSAFVAQVDKSKFTVQKALDEAQTLFDSLMQQYFG